MENPSIPIDPQVRHFWASAIQRHSAWLRTAARARLGDHHAAEEVCQEVNLAAMSQKEVLPSITEASAWFATVLSRQTALWHRKNSRGEKALKGLAAVQESCQDSRQVDDPAKAIVRNETVDRVATAIRDLEPPRKEIVILKLVEGKSYQAIAEQLGLTRHVVEYQFQQARQELRHQLVHWVQK